MIKFKKRKKKFDVFNEVLEINLRARFVSFGFNCLFKEDWILLNFQKMSYLLLYICYPVKTQAFT